MDRTVELAIDLPPEVVMDVMSDLTTYPDWMGLVRRVEPTDAQPGGGAPAYMVDLRARLGPIARSKRLRMVRSVYEPGRSVTFEREELEGRDAAPWVMSAWAEPGRLSIRLQYTGNLWARPVEQALEAAITRDRPRLLGLAQGRLGN